MNKEIEKELKKQPYIFNGGYDLSSEVDKLIKQAYLRGAKDLWEAVKMDKKPSGGKYVDYESYEGGYNASIDQVDRKAQQFIDSLEKDK